jgi:hypothetical protein
LINSSRSYIPRSKNGWMLFGLSEEEQTRLKGGHRNTAYKMAEDFPNVYCGMGYFPKPFQKPFYSKSEEDCGYLVLMRGEAGKESVGLGIRSGYSRPRLAGPFPILA